MPYDLTAVLTTIAAASASIVAILGGFIASKLIAISGERSAALNRLKQIDEELEFRVSERDKIQTEIDEDDALDFIRNAVDDLYGGNDLESTYSNVSHPNIEIDLLEPYWDRAVALKKEFIRKFYEHDALTDDYIPESLLATVKDDDFGYEVLLALGKKKEEKDLALAREAARAKNPLGIAMPDMSECAVDISSIADNSYSYRKKCDAIQEQDSAISLLELQKKQCNEQIQALQKPRGMRLGLAIFALFTASCIIAPLIASPFTTESHRAFVIIKTAFLGLLGIGLVSIFGYLIYLLKWNKGR